MKNNDSSKIKKKKIVSEFYELHNDIILNCIFINDGYISFQLKNTSNCINNMK